MQKPSNKNEFKNRSDCQNCKKPTNHNELDKWLSRLSHFSQFGLFTLTIGAFYFTVIPLYKTAALEEGIARREAELSVMNSKLNDASSALNSVKFEIYKRNRDDLIQEIVSVAPYCSGLMTRPTLNDESEERELGSNLLKINAAQCIRDEFDSHKSEAVLTIDDYQELKDTIELIASHLSEIQKKSILDIKNVPELAQKDPTTLAPPGRYSSQAEQLDRLIEEIAPGIIDKNAKYIAAIDRTRSNITLKFHDLVLSEVLTLRKIDWPNKENF